MSDSITDPNINRDEHDDSGGVKGKRVKGFIWDPSSLTWIKDVSSSPLAVRLDSTADPVLYVGKAPIATTTSTAGWQISKLEIGRASCRERVSSPV